MIINVSKNSADLGSKAAEFAASVINKAIAKKGEARMVVSTGSSQFELFESLLKEKVDWSQVEVFHLDEYVDLPLTHIASFRKYLYERFINHIEVKKFHSVDVEGDIAERIAGLSMEIRRKPIDLGLIGIGVNGHIAFNDPPADFDSHESYFIVELDEQCRLQQVDEGWFKNIDDVPNRAVSMTPWQIMQCDTIISVVPHSVKANAIKNTLLNRTTNLVPASLLKKHADYHLYIDYNSASEIILF